MTQSIQVASALGLFLIYASGIIFIGFYASTFAYLCTHMWLLGMHRPLVVLSVGIGTMAIVYGVFELFLGVSLPRGILF